MPSRPDVDQGPDCAAALTAPRLLVYARVMRTLRYGADATWRFKGFDLPLSEHVDSAILTVSAGWAADDEEQPPAPPNEILVLAIDDTLTANGQITEPQDDDGNWALFFSLTVGETSDALAPPPRYLWYEVTLLTLPSAFVFRPYVGQVRMLPDLYSGASS